MIDKFNNIKEYLKDTELNVHKNMEDFIIYRYNDVVESPSESHNPYRINFFEVSLEINEGCSFQIDNFKFSPKPNRLTFVSPGRLQTHLPQTNIDKKEEEESRGFTILFSEDFLNNHFNLSRFNNGFKFLNPKLSPAVYLSEKQLSEITRIFDILRYEYKEYGYKSSNVIKSLVQTIFEKAKQHYSQNTESESQISRQVQIAMEFEELCHNFFRTKHTVAEYAGMMNLSAKHLSEMVKEVTGKTALQIIFDCKLNHAKALISQTNLSVKEIAYESGFENVPYFSTFFKKHMGITPLEFRRI